MAKVHVRKGDTVYVLSGKDAGKTGEVLKVIPKSGRVIVEGVNMMTKHNKPRNQMMTGGIQEFAAPIDASNVMYVCPKCERPSKMGTKIADDGTRSRYCKACGETAYTMSRGK